MKIRATRLFFISFFYLFLSNTSYAQKFEWAYHATAGDGESRIQAITTDKDANSFVLGSFDHTLKIGDSTFIGNNYYNDLYFAKYSKQGEPLWVKRIGCATQDTPGNVEVDSQGNCYLTSTFSGVIDFGDTTLTTTGIDNIFIAKYTSQGERLWVKQLSSSGSNWFGDLAVDAQGSCYVTAHVFGGGLLVKYDKEGNVMWRKAIPASGKLAMAPDGSIYMSGLLFSTTTVFGDEVFEGDNTSFVCKFTREGNLSWATHLSQLRGPGVVQSSDISVDLNGNSYITGNCWGTFVIGKDTIREVGSIDSVSINHDIFVAKFDANGKGVWGMRAGNYYIASPGNILVDEHHSVYVSGHIYGAGKFKNLSIHGGNFVARLDVLGNVIWLKEAQGNYNGSCTLSRASSNKLYVTGSIMGKASFDGTIISSDTTLVNHSVAFIASLIDTVPPIKPNTIQGVAYHDVNSNCKFDSGDVPLTNIIVKAEPGPYYATTDSTGNYTLYVDKGKYTVSEMLPTTQVGKYIQQTCPASNMYSVTFNSYGKDTTGFDFGNQVTKTSFLKVDVAMDRRTRCFRSTTTVRYCNDGFVAAKDVQVQVAYPQYVVPISANVPWNRKDSLLTFTIGTLAPGACGTITIVDSVMCGNEQINGLTQCVKATITPKNTTIPHNNWDQSDLELKAVCKDNGFVRLTILNSGQGNMADSAAYRVYLDAEQVFAAQYQLASGDSLVLEVPVNGKTIRLEAALRPFNPQAERQPSVTLEGCGSANSVSISKGFVTQLPQDDAPEEVATACLEIRGSMDPNDKQVNPKGVRSNNIVAKGQELEYLIRFQNTGTDVAYTISIQDTLDEHLDVATLQIGAASHPFTWAVSGQGRPVLTWTFKNINLPDSNTNESQSHGFVRFRIGQNADLALGTPIHNQAAIYFDYNSPVLTNITTNTVDELPQNNDIKPSVQACGSLPSQAQAGGDVVINETSHSQLNAIAPVKGFGRWRLISGKAAIADVENHASAITELGVGKNIFVWTVKLCEKESSDSVTIERVVIPPYPAAQSPAPVCFGESLTTLTATGTNVKWYSDKALTKKIGEGNQFQPLAAGDCYVTQTVDGYESKATELAVVVKAAVPMPKADSVGYTCNGLLTQDIEAIGENLAWYADEAQTQLIATGAIFTADKALPNFLYVTQTIDGCESMVWKIPVVPGATDLTKKKLIPNVISPNGDGKNDSFRQPEFPENLCIGNFVRIHIYSRWGKLVFSSTDPAFAWMAQDLPNGLYQYEMQYSNIVYRGGLTVL